MRIRVNRKSAQVMHLFYLRHTSAAPDAEAILCNLSGALTSVGIDLPLWGVSRFVKIYVNCYRREAHESPRSFD